MTKSPKTEFSKNKINVFNMKMSHAVLISLFFSIVFLFVAFFIGDSENYIFPRLLAILLFILAIVLWLTDDNLNKIHVHSSLFSGLFIILTFILLLEEIGFYVGSFLIFMLLTLVYRDKSQNFLHKIAMKLIAATLFTMTLYVLFFLVLQVRIPNGKLLTIIF